MAKRLLMVPDGVRCTLTLFLAEPHAPASLDSPREVNSGELVKVLSKVGRRDVADKFLMLLIAGKPAQAELTDHEAASLFDSL